LRNVRIGAAQAAQHSNIAVKAFDTNAGVHAQGPPVPIAIAASGDEISFFLHHRVTTRG
jgi:hypothetical protein